MRGLPFAAYAGILRRHRGKIERPEIPDIRKIVRINIVRHGQTEWNLIYRWQGNEKAPPDIGVMLEGEDGLADAKQKRRRHAFIPARSSMR